MKRIGWLVPALVVPLLWAGELSSRQASELVRRVEVTVLPDPPAFGEPFELRVTLRVAPGLVVALPDTLAPSAGVESVGAGTLRSEARVAGDSIDLVVSYPVMAFVEGLAALPSIQPSLRPVGEARPGSAPGSQVSVGEPVEDLPGQVSPSLPLGSVEVRALGLPSGEAADAEPRGPADVMGGSWSVWDGLFAASALGLVGLGALGLRAVRRRGDAQPGTGAVGLAFTADAAVRELDRILASGRHREGRMVEFYEATASVLRRRLADLDPAWGPWMTGHELADRIASRWSDRATDEVVRAIRIAERVKFAGHPRDADAAERDLHTIRDWIAHGPEDR